MNIRNVPLHLIKPYENNVKEHPIAQLEAIKNSIERFGFRQPIVIDKDNVIVCGHARYEAAATLGIDSVPCEYANDLTEEEINAYRLLDNEIAKQGTTNLDKLQSELAKLPDFDFEPFNVEFPSVETINEGLCDEDDVPELKIGATTKLGDIWLLGGHRLMCGDSTSIDAVERLMDGKKATMAFTSPPYNADTHLYYGKGNNKKLYENKFDSKTTDEYINFCHEVLNNIFLVTDGFIFWNVNYNAKSRFEYIKGIYPFIDSLWETIIWKKTAMPAPSGLTRCCEFIFCFNKNDKSHLGESFKTEYNLWDISNKNSQTKEHHACFPVQLPEKGILLATSKDDSVLDLFGGSGSTLIACEKTNRKCFMMELSPSYCDLIIKRWQDFSGKHAIHADTKKQFNEMSPLV